MNNKLPELIELVAVRKPQIVAIVETWFTPDILDQEVCLPGYSLFRKDRQAKFGGGVAAYVKNGLRVALHQNQLLAQQPDSLWLSLRASNEKKCLTLGIVYRSPSASMEASTNINSAMHKACTMDDSAIIILGDFNFPNIDFRTGLCRGSEAIAFNELTQELGLTEHVQQTTRWREGQNASRLDLALSNEPHLIDKVELEAPLGLSDHAVIYLRVIVTVAIVQPTNSERRNFWKADYHSMKRHFSQIIWPSSDNCLTVNEQWEQILAEVQQAIMAHAPLYRRRTCNKNKNEHLSIETKRLIRQKRRLWDIFLLMQDELSRDTYNKVRNECTAAVRRDRRNRQLLLADTFIDHPKKFFTHVTSLTKSRGALSCLQGPSGLLNTSRDIAGLLAHQFSGVYNECGGTELPGLVQESKELLHVFPDFSISNVIRKLKLLKAGKSPGLDGVPPIVLQQCADELAQPLTNLFIKCYQFSSIPDAWKIGVISPIYKGGDRNCPQNYRPVALLSVVSKVMESIIDDAMREVLNKNSFFVNEQHGFRAGRSCVTNLLKTHEQWTKAADAGLPVDAIFLDFTKAFDRVDHAILRRKLQDSGLDGKINAWLASYLENRQYTVRVNGELSEYFTAPTGVPQGSILGPLLFLIFINDFPKDIHSSIVLYADDSKFSRVIRSASDSEALQQDLNNAFEWSLHNKLKFNTSKCKVLHIRNKNQQVYYLGNVPLGTVDHERDLGTLVTANLSLTMNTSRMTKCANTRLAMLSRILGKFSQESFPGIFNALVRPLVETNIQACSPFLAQDIKAIEAVQRRATKRVSGLYHLKYAERLTQLKLFPLTYRRARGDLILTFRILKDHNHPNRDLFNLARTTNLRGNDQKLFIQGSRIMCRQHSFPVRVPELWNKLPNEIVSTTSLEEFKTRLDNWLLEKWPITDTYTYYYNSAKMK
ncbi:MAG: reverse transcriptase family protein [Aeromonas sp.]